MEDHERWTLDINRKNLVKDLQVKEIEDHMIQYGIMDSNDFEKIHTSGKCRKERAGLFLDELVMRGPKAFGCFCDALQEKQSYLSQKLRQEAEMMAKKVGRGVTVEINALTLKAIMSENDCLKKTREELKKVKKDLEELQKKNDRLHDKFIRARKRSEELAEESAEIKLKQSESVQSMHTLLHVVNEKRQQRDEVERDVEGLEKTMYQMEEKLNVKEERIRRLVMEKRRAEQQAMGEKSMVSNLKGQIATMKEDMETMTKDVARVKRDRDMERKVAYERGAVINRMQRELMMLNQMKKNCESVIRHLNGSVQSKDQEARQAQSDLADLLKQYMEHKQTVD